MRNRFHWLKEEEVETAVEQMSEEKEEEKKKEGGLPWRAPPAGSSIFAVRVTYGSSAPSPDKRAFDAASPQFGALLQMRCDAVHRTMVLIVEARDDAIGHYCLAVLGASPGGTIAECERITTDEERQDALYTGPEPKAAHTRPLFDWCDLVSFVATVIFPAVVVFASG